MSEESVPENKKDLEEDIVEITEKLRELGIDPSDVKADYNSAAEELLDLQNKLDELTEEK